MGTCCSRDKDNALLQDVFESSANFWKAPSYDDLWKQHRPVLTEREIKAAYTILRAFRAWKTRQTTSNVHIRLLLVTHL